MATPDAELKVRIEADLTQFATGMNQAQTKLKEFGSAASTQLTKTSAAFTQAGDKAGYFSDALGEQAAAEEKAARLAATAQKELNVEISSGTSGLARFGKSATKGLSVLRNIAYVLPGIGVAGIFTLGFEAISKVVTELDLFNIKLSETQKNTRDLQNAQLGLIATRQKSEQDAQKELISIDALYRATQNNTLSLTERKKAVDELQTQYPKYLKNFSDEEILTGKATSGYNGLRQSILALAYAKAAEDDISKRSAENLKISYDFAVKQAAIDRLRREQAALPIKNPVVSESGENLQAKALSQNLILENQINNKIKEQDDLRRRVQVNLSIIDGLTKQIDKNVELNGVDTLVANIDKTSDAAAKKLDSLTSRLKEAREAQKLFGLQAAQELAKQIDDAVENNKKAISKSLGTTAQQQDALIEGAKKLGESMKGNIVGFVPNPEDVKLFDLMIKKVEDLQSTIQNGLTQSFTTFFDDILEKGTFSFGQLGKNILHEFEKILISQEAAKLAGLLTGAVTGVGSNGKPTASGILGGVGSILGIAGAASGAGGGAALAGGTAATGGLLLPILGGIAAAGLIASLFKKKKSDPYIAPAAVATSQASNISSNDFASGRVVFEISGANLVGVLNRSGQKLQRYNIGP